MLDSRRWILFAVAALAVVALLLFARGVTHHRGGQITGALGTTATTVEGQSG